MKIAITLNTSWNIYNFRMGLIRKFLSEGYEVIAIAPYDEFSTKLEEAGCTFVPIQMENTGANPIKDFKLFLQLKKIYQNHRPNIIFHFTIKPNIYGTFSAHWVKIPVINNVSGLGTVFLSKGLASYVAKKLYRKAFSYADLVFFQNDDDRKEFLSQVDLPKLKTALLPGSGINLSSFEAKPFKTSNLKTFVLIARLIVEKGVLEYINAAKITLEKYPSTKFQLLGKLDTQHARGIPKKVIDSACNEGVIEYLGETKDVKPFIQNASCVVLPSYREGTPRTLLEAAALARPIITTNVAGCKEVVIDQQTGLLCEVKNSEDLADKMMRICETSDEKLAVWGENGRRMVEEKFDEQIVIEQYLKHSLNIIN